MSQVSIAQFWNVAAGVVVGLILLMGYRFIRRRSHVLGRIVAAGILARAAVGLALFWISYLQLPIATSFYLGDGFWELAADARGYYQIATFGAAETLLDVELVPSPVFVRTLVLWMSLVGVSPASGLLLNLILYVALMLVLVWYYEPSDDWRRDLPCIVGVAAYSFSPNLVLHSTQPLKDNLACMLIGFACLGVLSMRGLIYRESDAGPLRATVMGVLVFCAATFGMAGIRWYYAALMLASVTIMLCMFAVRGRSTPWLPYARGCALVFAGMLVGFLAGVGPSYRLFLLDTAIAGPQSVAELVQDSRSGFTRAGGRTNIGLAAPTDPNHSGAKRTVFDQLKALSVGTAFLLLPISAIAARSGTLEGGQGLLPFVDIDTIFQDVAIAFLFALLWSRRREIGTRLPFVIFVLVLSLASILLMAYVVTNVGTMVRLRLLAMVPLWLLGMALSAPLKINLRSARTTAET